MATILTSSTAYSLQEPPPPTPSADEIDDSDPSSPLERFSDPRIIGPGWLESVGGLDASVQPKAPEGPVLEAAKIVSGFNHSCALTDAGGVRCWGDNNFGQLGDGTRTFRTTPVDVVGLTSGVVDVDTSHNHTCALTDAGGMLCWGYNLHGELGNGDTANSLTPVGVYGLDEEVVSIAAGGFHTCARMEDISVKCWGANWHGQVGDGGRNDRYTPRDVQNLEVGALTIVTGKFHSCAMTYHRDVKCWGYNKFGQQGNATTEDNLIARKAVGLGDGVRAVYTGGLHTCAWTIDHKIKCWGDNSEGQLGIGGIERSLVPLRVGGLTDILLYMSLGAYHTCGITPEYGIKCWGNNWAGQLGNLGTMTSSWPSDVVNLTEPIASLASGDSHTCAATDSGKALCWGSNGNGQLGNATIALSLAPVDVVNLNQPVSTPSAGAQHACALTTDGGVQCWGGNSNGQLGDGTIDGKAAPVDVVGLSSGVAKVETGSFHSCAVLNDGGLKCWGSNADGQLGNGTTDSSAVPVYVAGFQSGAVDVSAGASHTCVLMDTGGVRCWGKNSRGRLGDGTNVDALTPVNVSGHTSGVLMLEAGVHHTCILNTNGAVRCWGSNVNGQLGDGTGTDRWTSVAVSGLSGTVASIGAGDGHTCVRYTNGEVSCWGSNSSGQLGDGTFNLRPVPGTVQGLPGPVADLAVGYFHTCAVINGGSGHCWGDNWNGQLGDGTTTEKTLPTALPSLSSGVTSFVGGGRFTCARMDYGGMKCWGGGSRGQLGNGVAAWETAPVEVIGLTPVSLTIEHQNGQVGSYFHVVGEDFLPGTNVVVTLNGYPFNENVPVDPSGGFELVIDTTQADEGDYFLHVDGILRAMTIFHLRPEAPLLPPGASGILLEVPPGIGLGKQTYISVGPR